MGTTNHRSEEGHCRSQLEGAGSWRRTTTRLSTIAGTAMLAFSSLVPASPASSASPVSPLSPTPGPSQSRSHWSGWPPGRPSGPAAPGTADRRPGAPGAPTVPVGGNPVAVAVDEATHTAYIGNGNDNTVSVINTATCNARVTSGCGQVPPTITVGPGPVDDAVDQATDTVYVVGLGANNPTGDTVSVIDGATCNATVTSGCGQTPPTVTVGSGPDGVAVDQATDTIYVANANSNTVSVINGALCNGQVTSGCSQAPATVQVGGGPGVPAVDQATDTIYVPNSGSNTLSVIDGATCNALDTAGCNQSPSTLNVGPNAFAAAVDDATGTVYVTVAPGAGTAATTLGYLDVINGSTCNATVNSGCEQVPATIAVGSIPVGVVVDRFTGEVYVLNQEDGTVSIVDGATCNALDTAGCAQSAPELATGFEPGYLDIDVSTETVYVTNQNENDVSVLNAASCNMAFRFGCENPAPTSTVGTGPQGIAADQQTGTIYVANQNDDDLSVVDGATCNGWVRSGCGRSWPTVTTGSFPQAVAVDERTDTVYVANTNANTVSVINGANCNASVTTGCSQSPATVSVGEGPPGLPSTS